MIVGAPLFGEDEAAYAKACGALPSELGIDDRVEFRGHREDIVEELRDMDVLVHASKTPEPFGQVVVEGMWLGCLSWPTRGGGPRRSSPTGSTDCSTPAQTSRDSLRSSCDWRPTPSCVRGSAWLPRDGRTSFLPTAVAEQMMSAYELAERSGA